MSQADAIKVGRSGHVEDFLLTGTPAAEACLVCIGNHGLQHLALLPIHTACQSEDGDVSGIVNMEGCILPSYLDIMHEIEKTTIQVQ